MAEGLSQDFRYQARRILLGLARDILSWADRILDPHDPEPVHQMRVSINKLRVALRCFPRLAPGKSSKALLDDLRWIKTCLASVRDYDVMLDRLGGLAQEASDDQRRGVEVVLQGVENERAEAMESLCAETARKRYRRLKERLAAFAKDIKRNGAPRHPQDLPDSERLDALVAKTVKSLHRRFEKRRRRLIDSFAPDVMHRFRIAAKKLRYFVTFFRDQRPELYDPVGSTLRDLHDCVGAMHDIDVLAPKIEAIFARRFMAEPREPLEQVEPGAAWLLRRLHETRLDLMRRFYGLWEAVSSEEFAERCRRASTPPRGGISVVPPLPHGPEATVAE